MQRIATNRKDMINCLVEHSIERALSESKAYWLHEIFEKGFVGYGKFSDRQLRLEMELRGLDGEAENDLLEDEIESDEDFPFSMAAI